MSKKTHIRYRLYGIDIIETPKSGFNYSIYINPVKPKLFERGFTTFDSAKHAAERRVDKDLYDGKK